MQAGVPGQLTGRVHFSELGRWLSGHRELQKSGSQTSRRKAGDSEAEFSDLRRTTATHAQKMGSLKDIQAHLRHAKADTTANEYMQELPESVKQMVGSVYTILAQTHKSRKGSQRLLPNATNPAVKML